MSFNTDWAALGLPTMLGQNAFNMTSISIIEKHRAKPGPKPGAKRVRIRRTVAEQITVSLQSPEERAAARALRKSEWKLTPVEAADRQRESNRRHMKAKRAA